MNKYCVKITTNDEPPFDRWEFVVKTSETRDYVEALIEKHESEFDSAVELMDYLDYMYGIKWEDHEYDISVATSIRYRGN